ncbi:MFS transporter [Amycolatopsis jejuensis]|uniref:MFS transporter n=1 Tax=Amycolatopsis jejuensis TaxID=330084 RepID=UPI00068FB670|nr:MFS transporter [Amycolatopsis jejuensis]
MTSAISSGPARIRSGPTVGLLALTITAFAFGTTEFVIVGLLPRIAGTLGVSIPVAGFLVSGYALGVVIGAPLLTLVTARLPRKAFLVALVILFLACTVLCAAAPWYWLLLVARIGGALAHGAFFGVATVVATTLVPESRKGTAIAVVFTGLTVATVLGVPLGTALGEATDWRMTFWAVTLLGVIGLAGIVTLVPRQERTGTASVRGELAAFGNRRLWLALATAAFGHAGLFAALTYVNPILTGVTGFAAGDISLLLVVVGAGMLVGNLVSGRIADRRPAASVVATLACLLAVLVVAGWAFQSPVTAIAALFGVGAAGFGTVAPLQRRILDEAGDGGRLASAANVSALNVGNMLGSLLGGVAISAGFGLVSPFWVGAALTGAGLLLAVFAIGGSR